MFLLDKEKPAVGTAGAVCLIIVIAGIASVRKVMVVDPAIVFRG